MKISRNLPFIRLALPVICLAALSGCATKVHKLNELNPAANDFPSSLASEYHDYADSEYEQGRFSSAEYFAGKGLCAFKGKPLGPDAIDTSLPEGEQRFLLEGREQLVKFLNPDMERVTPQKLARAQLLFDCWQNELHRDINQVKAPCEEEFHSTMAELQEVSDALIFHKETNHVIVFARKSTKLDAQARAAIQDVAQKVAHKQHYRVVLMVYTGRGIWQRRLTEMRMHIVRHALIKAGVKEKYIKAQKEGGAKAVVLSRDNIAMNTKKITILVKTHDHAAREPKEY